MRAQEWERVCDPKDPEKCSQALEKGEEAPFAGQLLTPKLAISLGQKAERFEVELELERDRDRALAQVDLDLERKLHKLDAESWAREKSAYTSAIADLSRWYRNPFFAGALGLISGILISLVISAN